MELLLFIITAHIATATAVIILGPTNKTYPEGSEITLTCHGGINGTLYWSRGVKRQLLFYGNQRQTSSENFQNFDVIFASGYSNMTIKNARVEDQGFFICSLLERSAFTNIEIEVTPEMKLHWKKKKVQNSDTELSRVTINCSAYGARPKVLIQFKVGNRDWQPPSSWRVIPRDMLYDTTALLHYNIPKNTENVTVYCRTLGQVSIPSVRRSLSLYVPVCNLHIEDFNARCHCRAVPEVFMYKIKIGSQYILAQEETLVTYGNSNVTCFGTNAIGTGESDIIYFTNNSDNTTVKVVMIMIIICLLLVASIVAYICMNSKRKGKKQRDKSNEEPSNQPMLPSSMNTTGYDESQLKKEFENFLSKLREISTYDRWDIFAFEILEISPETLRKLRELHEEKHNGTALYELLIREIPVDDVEYMSKLLRCTLKEKSDLCKEFGMKLTKGGDMCHEDDMLPQTHRMGKASKKATKVLDKKYSIIKDKKQCEMECESLRKVLPKILLRDWEIFAIKILQMPVENVKAIVTNLQDLTDHIPQVETWYDNKIETSRLQSKLRQEAELCRRFGLTLTQPDSAGDRFYHFTENTTLQEIISPNGKIDQLCKILNACGDFTGPVGAEIIQSIYVTFSETKTLKERFDSIEQFANVLEQNFLFRVKHAVKAFQNLIKDEIKLLEHLGNDWEVFAVNSMSLVSLDVQNIITETTEKDEQVARIMLKWEETVYDEENKAEALKSWIKEVQENNKRAMLSTSITSKEDFLKNFESMNHETGTHLQRDRYRQMLEDTGQLIGPLGASHVAEMYETDDINSNARYIKFVGSGFDMLCMLLNKNYITNEERTLELLKTRLHESNLFRAENLINRFLHESHT